jgi:murein DD-endopeptidase MepM/ murein hydrolase activator NlpD
MRLFAARFSFVLAAVLFSSVAVDTQSSDIVLTVSRADGVLHAGDAVLVSVETTSVLTGLEGQAFGQRSTFWAVDERRWHGLIGIDIDAKPGTYHLDVRATSAHGAAHARTPLLVAERRVETRRIRVADRFMTPPQEEAARIALDAERLNTALARSQVARVWRGPFIEPVSGSTTSGFGRLTIMNNVPRGRHRGVDFRAAEGTPVLAPNAGLVVLASDLYFTGNTVVLDHGDGLFSLLAHLSHIAVQEGTQIAGGDLVGAAGSTGRVTGPHLHWAVRLNTATVDPLSLISALSASH